jgi:hypothetical protein
MIPGFSMQELSDWTPLGLAVLARDVAGVSALLEGGANPNERFLDAKRKGRGFFPLEYAVYLDTGPVVEALLRGGASRDVVIECGKGVRHTPLSLAEAKGKKAAVAALQPPPPVQEAPKKEEAAKPVKSPMLSQRGALTSQRLAAPAPSTMTSQTSPGAQRSAARPGPAGSSDSLKKSPRVVSTKNASAVVNYGDLVLGEEIGKGAYGKVRSLGIVARLLICYAGGERRLRWAQSGVQSDESSQGERVRSRLICSQFFFFLRTRKSKSSCGARFSCSLRPSIPTLWRWWGSAKTPTRTWSL